MRNYNHSKLYDGECANEYISHVENNIFCNQFEVKATTQYHASITIEGRSCVESIVLSIIKEISEYISSYYYWNMDLKESRFDAFKGNPLVKPSLAKQRTNFNRMGLINGSGRNLNNYSFDALWKGSINNLMSSENLTQDLISESIKELENAMQESKRMLVDRDNEIVRLREIIENNKKHEEVDESKCSEHVLEEFEKSQKQIIDLECEISRLKVKHLTEIKELKETNQKSAFPPFRTRDNKSECTCFCGSACKALNDLSETKKSLENTKSKYEGLKRKVREFRNQTELNHRNALNHEEQQKGSSCSLQ